MTKGQDLCELDIESWRIRCFELMKGLAGAKGLNCDGRERSKINGTAYGGAIWCGYSGERQDRSTPGSSTHLKLSLRREHLSERIENLWKSLHERRSRVSQERLHESAKSRRAISNEHKRAL